MNQNAKGAALEVRGLQNPPPCASCATSAACAYKASCTRLDIATTEAGASGHHSIKSPGLFCRFCMVCPVAGLQLATSALGPDRTQKFHVPAECGQGNHPLRTERKRSENCSNGNCDAMEEARVHILHFLSPQGNIRRNPEGDIKQEANGRYTLIPCGFTGTIRMSS